MLPWHTQHQDWEGTAEELADLANTVADRIGLDLGESPFNERVIRSYVQVGALDRPERRGREAHFGFRQLAQCLAVRMLLGDSWPLARIADYMQITGTEALIDLLPKPGAAAAAQALVRRFQKQRTEEPRVLYQAASPPLTPPDRDRSARQSVTEGSADLLRRRTVLRDLSTSLSAASTNDTPDVCMRIELVPGCQVYVDRSLIRAITRDQADQLGEALSHALIDRKLSTKGDKK